MLCELKDQISGSSLRHVVRKSIVAHASKYKKEQAEP
jgi:hypothetical protein